jgi:hypothetical protein
MMHGKADANAIALFDSSFIDPLETDAIVRLKIIPNNQGSISDNESRERTISSSDGILSYGYGTLRIMTR